MKDCEGKEVLIGDSVYCIDRPTLKYHVVKDIDSNYVYVDNNRAIHKSFFEVCWLTVGLDPKRIKDAIKHKNAYLRTRRELKRVMALVGKGKQ